MLISQYVDSPSSRASCGASCSCGASWGPSAGLPSAHPAMGGAEGRLWSQERRLKAEGQPGELGGEGLGKLGPCLDLHQSHSMPLPEGVSVTVDTVRAATGSKKGASPPAVFTVAADARDGMPPPQAMTDSRALFMDVLGQADFDPGEAGTSPRHMVRAPAHAKGVSARRNQLPGCNSQGSGEGLHAQQRQYTRRRRAASGAGGLSGAAVSAKVES